MNVIYLSRLCSKQKFKELFDLSKVKLAQQGQKYHMLLTKGFSKLEGVSVTVLSGLPVTFSNFDKRCFRKETESENGIDYQYIGFFNFPVIKHFGFFFGSFFSVLKLSKKDKDSVVICDILCISISAGALLAAKLKRVKNVAIVTDVPAALAESSIKPKSPIGRLRRFISKHVSTFIMNRFGSYVFLTKQMNDLINKKNRKYAVIEGQVDTEVNLLDNELSNKFREKVCIYAGSVKKIYGIEKFAKAFEEAEIDAELHIYGGGEYVNELIEVTASSKKVKYKGVIENDEMIKLQTKATLLVNPRPNGGEYTKYSFPSKNMEYMASGTPVFTTDLPGMPSEYRDYVYVLDDTSTQSVKECIERVLNKTPEELHEFGAITKEYVLKNKNNIMAAEKIMGMIKNIG